VATQTVDSRTDPRYSTEYIKNFPFGNNVFRGGLFVGFANDPSKVARSYIQFHTWALPADTYVWAASASMYLTRMETAGGMEIGCQRVELTEAPPWWTAGSLIWGRSPGFESEFPGKLATATLLEPARARSKVSVSWDPAQNPTGEGWYHWQPDEEMMRVFEGYRYLSLGFAATTETQNKWAFFAKTEYDYTKAPFLLYAKGDTGRVFGVSVPNSTTGGTDATCTVWLNGPAPSGGATVWFASDDPFVTWPPACVQVPAGALRVNFTMHTAAVTAAKDVVLRAFWQSREQQAVLHVVP
jgi:hypothetical protein